ncbi:MAG: M56 family metallopeptidase [Candidatus Zixiibacteriota bacterium]
MIQEINNISQSWFSAYSVMFLINLIFSLSIIALLYLLKEQKAILLKIISMAAIIKLMIPPFIAFDISRLGIFKNTRSAGNLEISYSSIDAIALTMPKQAAIRLSFESWLFLFWIIGSFGLIALFLFHRIKLQMYISGSKNIAISSHILPKIPSINFRFRITGYEHSPFVAGIFRPVIYLPVIWHELPDDKKKLILAHEIAHIKAGDRLFTPLISIARVINFANPFAWILIDKYFDFSERNCDDYAIESLKSDKITYIKNILDICRTFSRNSAAMNASTGFSRNHKKMLSRIKYQLKRRENIMKKPAITTFAVFAITFAVVLFSMKPAVAQQEKDITIDKIELTETGTIKAMIHIDENGNYRTVEKEFENFDDIDDFLEEELGHIDALKDDEDEEYDFDIKEILNEIGDFSFETDTTGGKKMMKFRFQMGDGKEETIELDAAGIDVSENGSGNVEVKANDKDVEVMEENGEGKKVKTIVKSKSIVIDGDEVDLHDEDDEDVDVDVEFENNGKDGETIKIMVTEDGEIEEEISIPMSISAESSVEDDGVIMIKINEDGKVIEKKIRIDADSNIEVE